MTDLTEITFIDLETTGLHNDCEIVEIATGKYEPYNISSCLYKTINKIPPESSAIHNISNRMVQDKLLFSESIANILNLLHTNNTAIYIAHHVDYDYKVLCKELKKYVDITQYSFSNYNNWICTLELSKLLLGNNQKHSLNYLKYYLELDDENDTLAHRAESDVNTTMKLFSYLLNLGIKQRIFNVNGDLIQQVQDYINANRNEKYNTWSIGKHKGKPYSEIDNDYLLWAAENLKELDENSIHFDKILFEKVMKEFDRRIAE